MRYQVFPNPSIEIPCLCIFVRLGTPTLIVYAARLTRTCHTLYRLIKIKSKLYEENTNNLIYTNIFSKQRYILRWIQHPTTAHSGNREWSILLYMYICIRCKQSGEIIWIWFCSMLNDRRKYSGWLVYTCFVMTNVYYVSPSCKKNTQRICDLESRARANK